MQFLLWIYLGLGFISLIKAAEILAITPISSSHWNVMNSVLEILLNRGHNITVVTAYARQTPHENYTQIDVLKKTRDISTTWETMIGTYRSAAKSLELPGDAQLDDTCRTAFEHPELEQTLLDGRFDLVVTELLGSRCDASVAGYLDAPRVTIVSGRMLARYQDSFGGPSDPAYAAAPHPPSRGPETYVQRVRNVIDYARARYADAAATATGRSRLGHRPPDAETLFRNASVVFLNTHSGFDMHRPMAADFKEIGGVHLRPPEPLPADLQKYIDNAEHGVIYFSLGSMIEIKKLPVSILNMIKEGFAELPQKILWKFETDQPMENKPKNVLTKKWFPQYDVLRHPNVRLFITHGGNLCAIEAVSAAIPVLGFSMFFDQPRNLKLFKYWGSGLYIDYNNFSKEDFVEKIKLILNDPRFKENAMALSHRFNDRPVSPQDTVAYWTEYVLRHDGAHHLKSQAINTEWYKYFSLDFLVLVYIVVTSILYFLCNVLSIMKI